MQGRRPTPGKQDSAHSARLVQTLFLSRERLLLCRRQVHFDNNHTLTLKQQALRAAGARGVAWWNTGSVDYGTADHQAEVMWDAMSAFAGPRAAPAPLPPV